MHNQVLENRVGGEKRLTIGEMNQRLDELCKVDNSAKRKQWLLRLIRDCSAREHKWIVRIILKEMRIGLTEEKVLKYYHPDASDMFVQCRADSVWTPSACTSSYLPLQQNNDNKYDDDDDDDKNYSNNNNNNNNNNQVQHLHGSPQGAGHADRRQRARVAASGARHSVRPDARQANAHVHGERRDEEFPVRNGAQA